MYHYEDLPVGSVHECGSRTVTKEEILAFARQYDPQPFHVDEEAARRSPYGGIIASGWHTCGIAMRLYCDAILNDADSTGSPGVEKIQWLRPVRPGDTLRLTIVVLQARVLKSKRDVGLVLNRWELRNQEGDEVMRLEGFSMLRLRNRA